MTFSAIRVATGQGLRVPPLVGLGFIIQDEKSQGADGGASSVDTDNIRDLNTEIVNTITGAILGTNQFTLPAGTYDITAKAATFGTALNRISLYNVTDAGDSLLLEDGSGDIQLEDGSGVLLLEPLRPVIGISDYSNIPGFNSGGFAWLQGRFTISGTKVFEIRHYTELASSVGMGLAVSDGVNKEVYTVVSVFEV